MTKTLIQNVDVVSLDDAGTVDPNVALAIDGPQIVAIEAARAEFQPAEGMDGWRLYRNGERLTLDEGASRPKPSAGHSVWWGRICARRASIEVNDYDI